MDETYRGDEETMIPKGLLDLPWEKTEEPSVDQSDYQNANTLHCGFSMPCFVAFVPPEYPNNIGERYQNNFGQTNEIHLYPQLTQQMMTNYSRPQGNDYYFQYKRNTRPFNVLQPRIFQDMEYTWCNQMRPNQNYISMNSGMDMRTANNSRNNSLLTERVYIPLQPINTNRYPFDYQQRISNTNSYCLGYEGFPGQTTNFKIPHKSNIKVEREAQTDQFNPFIQNVEKQTCVNNGFESNNLISEECSVSQGIFNSPMNVQSCLINETFIEKNTFRTASYYGCLQLEQMVNDIPDKMSGITEITQLCSTLKSDLTKPNSLEPNYNAGREMIAVFLQICFSWVCLNDIRIFNQNKVHAQFLFEALNDCISKWEENSIVLIQNLITAIQSTPLDESCIETPVIKILKKNLNKTRNSESEFNNGPTKKRNLESEPNCLNYNWRKSSQTSLKDSEKNESEFVMCQLIPESHKSTNESSFVCDNFMQILKKTQERMNNKTTNYPKYMSQKSKECHSRGRFTLGSQNNMKENSLRNEPQDKIFPDSLKKSKIPLPSHRDHFLSNSGFSNFNKIINFQTSFDESRNINQPFTEKYNEKQFSIERILDSNNSDGSHLSENERSNKHVVLPNVSNATKSENISENTSAYDKGKGKRYSQQYKKKNNLGFPHGKENENSDKIENTAEMSSSIKLKLYEILIGIQMTDLRKNASEKINPRDEINFQQSLIDPINGIARSLIRNSYKTVDEIVGNILSISYQAKIDNKGNLTLLTTANQLETKLMNAIYLEIGTL